MNKIIDEQYRGDRLIDLFSLQVGQKVLWELQLTNRERHPYRKGDLVAATIMAPPWVNGKVLIKASIGIITTVRINALYEDKRFTDEQKKTASEFDQASVSQR